MTDNQKHKTETCTASIAAVRDALYVLSGKWKFPLIIALSGGPVRFKNIQRALDGITPKVLSKELRDLELNGFVERRVFSTVPVSVTYELTPYSDSLGPILEALRVWGTENRKRIVDQRRGDPAAI